LAARKLADAAGLTTTPIAGSGCRHGSALGFTLIVAGAYFVFKAPL